MTAVGSVVDCDNDMVPLKPGIRPCVFCEHPKVLSVSEQRSTDPVTQFRVPVKLPSVPLDSHQAEIELDRYDEQAFCLFYQPVLFVSFMFVVFLLSLLSFFTH